MPLAKEKPETALRQGAQGQSERKRIAELLRDREPLLDVVQFSAPWRPLARLFGTLTS